MASERIQNEYDAVRIANGLDTLAENLAGYTPPSPVTPTAAMKAKLPSQSTGDRIADAVEQLATNLTDISNAEEITYAEYNTLTPAEKSNGTVYYITDYPSFGGVYYFQTKDAMDAAIAGGSVPNNAVCLVDEDTPYVVNAQDIVYGDSNVKDELDELNSNKIISSAPANTTWASQLAVLETVWNGLTNDEKLKCKIIRNGTIYYLSNRSTSQFAFATGNNSDFSCITVNLIDHTAYIWVINASGATLQDSSNNNSMYGMDLVI